MEEPLKRKQTTKKSEGEEEKKIASVSAGPVEKVVELAFNPSREKIPEMTVIDRIQARLLPQLNLISLQWDHTIEIAIYRQDSNAYEKVFNKPRPVCPNLLEEYMYRVAQWQKSIAGTNLKEAINIALAETEAKAGEEEFGKDADKYYGD